MLSSDFANLAAEAARMAAEGADWLHMDVMVRAAATAPCVARVQAMVLDASLTPPALLCRRLPRVARTPRVQDG
jgi:hypothetical protein